MERRGWRGAALQGTVLLGIVLLLSVAVNRPAFRGYFEDDDLDTLTWARVLPLGDLVLNIPSLKYPPEHARPTGYFFYTAIHQSAGLDYPPYVAVLQSIHVLNICLLWLILRRMGLEPVPCAIGCVVFAMHRALFDAWWKPMFIYDVLCTTFALMSLLAYAYRRWVLSFIAFWLAMRSKEVGIVVPVILLWYEMTLGKGNWKRVLPFFVPATIYGGYGLIYNLHQRSTYSFHFGGAALWKSVTFYFSRVIQITYAGFALLLLPMVARDRRVYFGIGMMLLGLAIYLLLPGRLLEIYLYLAMTGVAIAMAAAASRRPALAAALVMIWIGWQYLMIRKHAGRTLAEAEERREYVAALRRAPDSPVYIYDAIPGSMHSWGVEGALRLYHRDIQKVHRREEAGLPVTGPMELVDWDARDRHLYVMPFSVSGTQRVAMEGSAPRWQFKSGWGEAMGRYRAIGKRATARLYRPSNAVEFHWEACGEGELRTFVNGEELPKENLTGGNCVTRSARLKPAREGLTTVDFLSIAAAPVRIGTFGFSGEGK